MAEMTDSLGRFIQGQNTSNMTLGQIKELLSSGLKVGVGEAKGFGKKSSESTSSGSVSKLTSLFEQYTKSFSNDIKEQKDYIKQMIGVLTEIKNSKEENKKNPKEKKDKKNKSNDKAFKSMEDLAKKGLHKGSIYTHDIHCEHLLKDIGKDLKNIAKKMGVVTTDIPELKLPADYAGGGGDKGGGGGDKGGGGGGGGEKDIETAFKRTEKQQKAFYGRMLRQGKETARTIEGWISEGLLGLSGGVFGKMLDGLIRKDIEIIQQTRAIAYEIEGATKNSKSLNKSFEDFGKTVKATGVSRDVFAKNYIDTMKIGIKNAKIAQKITVAQLNTERQLGMEAESLKDTFQTMATDLHMNTAEVADMGRGMRDVARFTGLTGDKLKGVIDSSAEFSKNMQKAGNLTAQSYKNIIELGANFKKFGADGSQILTMLSSTNKLLEGNSETFTLLAQSASRVGLTSELLSGSLLKNKKSLQGLYQGMKSIAGQFGIAGNNAEEMRASLENMDDFTKARMNISLKAAYGMEAGELLNTLEAVGASSETLSDKLDNLNKKKQKNLTLEERAGIVEEERKLKLSKSMEVLASIDKAASSSKDMGEALGKFSKQRSTFEGDLKALGVAWTSETDVARGAITNALDGVNKQLKDAGKAELKISSDEIEKAIKDPTAIRELTAKITKAEQEASTASKAQLDPVSSSAQSLMEINDTLRNLSQNGLSSIFNSWIGKLIVPLLAVVAGVVGLGRHIERFWSWAKGWGKEGSDTSSDFRIDKKSLEEMKKHSDPKVREMAEKALKRGSIFVHDIHLEKILLAIHETIKNCCMGDKGKTPVPQASGKPDPMAALTQAKPTAGKADPMAALTQAKPTTAPTTPTPPPIPASTVGKVDKQANDALKQRLLEQKSIREGTTAPKIAPPKPAGISDTEKIAAAQKRGISESGLEKMKAGLKSKAEAEGSGVDFRLQRKIEEHQKKKMKAEKVQMKHDGKMMRVEKEEVKVGMPAADSSFLEDAISQIKNIKTEDLIKAGGILMALAAALVILGIGIVFLGSKLLKLTGLDLATVAETAAVVVAVGAAAGGIAYASLELLGKIEELKSSGFMEKFKGGNAKELLMVAGAVAILGPILIILGAAVIKAAQLITSKLDLDLSKILEVSAIVVALGVAAGGIAVASVELIEQLEKVNWESIDFANVLLGAAVLLVIGPAMVLLGAAIIKMSDLILGAFNLDLKTVIRVGATVAAIMLAAGLIALAAIAALPELFELGLFAELLLSNPLTLWTIGYGAAALLVLAPAIVLLGAAIIKMSDWILGAFNLDASTALKIGMTVAGVIAAAAIIAVAVLGAVAGLAGLGVLATTYPSWLWMMPLGAGALLVLTPAILMLAVAIIRMSEWLLGSFNLDASTAWEIGMTVAGVIAAAAVIAVAILGAVYGLTQLGVLASTYIAWGWMFLLGAGALLALTPVILTLASAVIKMSEGILGAFGLDSGKALEVAENVAGIIAAAALIAIGIIAAIAGLTYLGILATMVYTYAPLMLLGAAALLLLTRPIIALASNIISLADSVLGSSEIDPTKAKETTEAVASILNSAGDIAIGILSATAGLVALGSLVVYAGPLAGMLAVGALALLVLTPAILLLSGAILKMANALSFEKGQAEKIVENLDATLDATTSIALSIIKMANKLAIISVLAMSAIFLIPLLYLGSWALWALTLPIRSYVTAVTNFYDSLVEIISPKKAVEMGKGVSGIMGAVGTVTEEIMKAKDKLSNLSQYAGFFDFLIGNSLAKTMYAGGKVLRALMLPTAYYAISVVNFSRFLASIIEPKKATQMGKDVAELLAGIAAVTDEIMKVKDKLANFPEYGSFWNWLTNNKLPDQMWKGVATLLEIMNPTKMYVMAIVLFSRNIASIIDPRKATEMGRGVAEILAGVASVNEEIMKVKDKLINVPKHSGFWTWLRGIPLQETLREGVLALHEMMGPVTTYIQTIVAFSKRVGSVINPKLAKSMGQGVADIIDGCMVVTDAIYKAKDKLVNVPKYSKFWAWVSGGSLSEIMDQGVLALKDIMEPTKKYIESIVTFSKTVGSVINPKQAKEMGQGVADVIDGCMVVTDAIYKVKDKLKKVPMHSKFWEFFGGGTLQDSMNEGVYALNSMMAPVKNYAASIVKFSKSVGEVINPKQAKEMGQGIADILASIGQVSDEIIKAKDKILSVGGLTNAVKDFVKLYGAAIAFRIMGSGILSFTNAMVGVVKQIESKVDVETGKRLISVMKNVGELVSLTAQTVKDLNEKILPLTEAGWFSGSIVSQLNSAMPQFQSFFSTVPKFITDAIVKPMNTAFKDVQGLQDAGMKIKAIGILLSQVHPVIQQMQSKIVPYTESGFFNAAPIDKIKAGMDAMRNFFTEVASFITNGIVIPVTKNMASDDDLIDANLQLTRMAVVLGSAGRVIKGMMGVIAYMDPASFFSQAPVEKIMKNKDEFQRSFIAIAEFVKDGIVKPALSVGDSGQLKTAAERLCQTASIMRSTAIVLKSVDQTFGLMESKSIFSDSPITKIMKNKDEFQRTFLAISQFIRDGIVTPVLATFPDPSIMVSAAVIMQSMAKTISAVPPIIKNLAAAIGLMTESKSFFAKTPVETIMKNKDAFAKYFRTVAAFVRDAIVVEINTAFSDVPISKIVEATSILTNLSKIISIIPKVIKGVSDGLIPLVVSKDAIKKAPLKAISESKEDFANYFRETAAFLRDGVVMPILEEFPDASILAKATSIITMIAQLLPNIPRVINQTAQGLIPLVVSRDAMKKAPMKMIKSSKDIFSEYFVSVAEFLRDGIVTPILEVLPDTKTIAKATSIITMMAQLLPTIPRVINSLSSLLGLLDPKDCMKDSPMAMLAKNAIIFEIYFYTIATFLKEGIIEPILSGMVDSKDLQKANQAISNMDLVIREIPVFIQRLSDGLSSLMFSGYFDFAIFSAAKIVGAWFSGIAYALIDGIIIPLRLLPDDSELKEIITKLQSVTQIFGDIRQTLDSFAINLQPLTEGGFFTKSPIASLYSSAKIFAEYWSAITSFIANGIIKPISQLSPSAEIDESSNKLKKSTEIFGEIRNTIEFLTIALEPLTSGGIFSSSPIASLASSAQTFSTYWSAIATFIQTGIITPVNQMSGVEELKSTSQKLGVISSIINGVKGVIDSFSQQIQPLTGSWLQNIFNMSPMAYMLESAKNFASYWVSIASFIQIGIITPVSQMSSVEELKTTSQKLNIISNIINGVRGVIDSFSQQIQPLTGNWLQNIFNMSPMAYMLESAKNFASYWTGIAHFIQTGIIEPVNKMSSVDKLNEVMSKLNFVSGVLKAVRGVIDTFSEQIQPLTGNWLQTLLGISPIATMYESAKSFASYWTGIAHFIQVGIIEPVFKISGVDKLKEVIDKLNFVSGVLKAVRVVIDTFSEQIQPLTGNWLTRLFAISPIATMYESAKSFASYWTGIAHFIQVGIIEPVNKMSNVEKLTEVINKLNFVSGILKAVRVVIDTFSEQIQPLTGNWLSNIFVKSPIATMYESAKSFASYWAGIANFIQVGIIEPVNKMSNVEKLTEVMTKLTFVSGIFIGVRKVIDTFSEQIQPLTGSWLSNIFVKSPIATMYESAKSFASYWTGIANFIQIGIIEPVNRMSNVEKLTEVMTKLTFVSGILIGVRKVIDTFSEQIQPLTGSWLSNIFVKSPIATMYESAKTFASYWIGIANFINNGIIRPISTLPDASSLNEITKSLVVLPDILKEVYNVSASLSENIAPLTDGGWFTKSPIEKIYKSIKTFSSYWVGISSFLTNGIINPIMNNLPDSTELTEALTRIKLVADMLIEIQKAMFGMSNIMLNMSSMNLPGMNIDDISGLETQFGAMAKLTNAAGSQIGGLSASGGAMEANNPVATAIPPEPSMREKVQKEVVTSEPNSSTVSSPELTEIASEAVTQTELNEQMVELLTQIKDALGDTDNSTKSSAGGMGGDTEARKVRNKPFMNTKWAYGSFLQTGGKGVTNVGSGTK
jgi:plasmid maintenance system antidote protein VapI